MRKGRGVSKFFGVVVGYNHCRTIPPSLLTGTLPGSPFYSASSASPFLSLLRLSLFSSPTLVFRLTALSLSVPAGLRGQHGEISDQFFKPRVPRLYTPWETTLGWAMVQPETFLPLLGSRGGRLVLRPRCRGCQGDESEIKPRRKLKRGTEGSWKDRGQDAHAPHYHESSPRAHVPLHQSCTPQLNTSFLLAIWLFFSSVGSTPYDCSPSYIWGDNGLSFCSLFTLSPVIFYILILESFARSADARCPCSFTFHNEELLSVSLSFSWALFIKRELDFKMS